MREPSEKRLRRRGSKGITETYGRIGKTSENIIETKEKKKGGAEL